VNGLVGLRLGAGSEGLPSLSWLVWGGALAAVVGGLLGAAVLTFCVILPDGFFTLGCSLDQLFGSLRLSRVLTTLSLGGVCVLMAGPWSRLVWVMGALAALLSLATLVWAVAEGPIVMFLVEQMPDVPEPLLYASGTALWGRPIFMVILGAALLWAGRWLPALLLFVLGALEAPLLVVSPGSWMRVLNVDNAEWPVLLLGGPGLPPGLIGAAGWTLLGTAILFWGLMLKERRLGERRRAVAEENGRKARCLYEKAWDAGNLSVVNELVAADFFDHLHHRRGPEEFKRTIADLHRTFPDLSVSVEEQHVEDDTVTTRCVLSGTDRGGVLWYPPRNKRASFTDTYTDRFSDGKLVEHRGESDIESLLRQLGLSPLRGDEAP
jgi:predicted ester cyclase